MGSKHVVSALSEIRNFHIDEAKLRAHVMRPAHVLNIISSRGLEDVTKRVKFDFSFQLAAYYHLDVNGFGDAMQQALKDQAAGYVMRLREQGSTIYTREWNWAKGPLDGFESWTPDVGMHIASCSKLITAIAMTKALNERQISYDEPMSRFLPHYWSRGQNIDKITFRQLMTHTSGFNTGSFHSDFEFMREAVGAGVTEIGTYYYQNLNFGLCRILLATIVGDVSPLAIFDLPIIPDSNNVVWDYLTIQSYVKYVQGHVFVPAGVADATLDHPDPSALAYNFPTVGMGWNSGDLTAMSGGAGWHMTVDDVLSIMGTFRRKGSIVPSARAQEMLDDGFGIDFQTATPMGIVYGKTGLWKSDDGSQAEQSLLCFLPRNMELVAFVNSPIGSPTKLFSEVFTSAYMSNLHVHDAIHRLLH